MTPPPMNPYAPQPGDVTVHLDDDGRVRGIDHPPGPPPGPVDPVVDTVRVELDPTGSGLFPSLYLVEVVPGDVITYVLSADSLPDVRRMSWRTRAMLRGYLARLGSALDEAG